MRQPLKKPMGMNGFDEKADGQRYADAVEVEEACVASTHRSRGCDVAWGLCGLAGGSQG